MRTGVQQFLGSRLSEARRARGISSRKALADLLGKSASTVGRWEDGESFPEPAALADLSRKLALPVEFFLADKASSPSTGFFRSLSSALVPDRERQVVRLRWLMDIAEVADHYAHLPEVRVPSISGLKFQSLRDDEIESIASSLRDAWGVGQRPIANVVQLMEENGIIVAAETMGTSRLDGISAWDASLSRPFVLLADDKQSFARRQFDCAHELGHLMLHREVSEETLLSDFDLIEGQANKFASAFLLPGTQFPLDVTDLSMWGFERLKTRWKVSIKAIIMRLRELEIIPSDMATRLFKSYSAKGYSRGEPYDDVWPLQTPFVLSNVLRALADSGVGKSDLLADVGLGAHDVEALANLPEGWFSLEPAHIIPLRDSARPGSRPRQGSAEIHYLNKPPRN